MLSLEKILEIADSCDARHETLKEGERPHVSIGKNVYYFDDEEDMRKFHLALSSFNEEQEV